MPGAADGEAVAVGRRPKRDGKLGAGVGGDGRYPEEGGEKSRPARPVLVDVSDGWPGVATVPWPAAERDREYQAPRLAERSRGRKTLSPDTPIASWLPVRYGMTTHGLRHANQTWMGEDRVADVLRDERMGHSVEDDVRIASAMRDHYTHFSEQMRGEVVNALQKRWETALMERVELERSWAEAGIPRRSTVPLLDRPLQPYRDSAVSRILQPTLRRRAGRLAGRGSPLAEVRG